MSAGDLRVISAGGLNAAPMRRFVMPRGKGAIAVGEPVWIDFTPTGVVPYPVLLRDEDPIRTTYWLGVAAGASTQTATADGSVDIYLHQPGFIYRGTATTASTADTQTEIDQWQGYHVALDLISGKFTVKLTTSDSTKGLIVLGGNPNTSSIDFAVMNEFTWLANLNSN